MKTKKQSGRQFDKASKTSVSKEDMRMWADFMIKQSNMNKK